jgi:hypothetical protein
MREGSRWTWWYIVDRKHDGRCASHAKLADAEAAMRRAIQAARARADELGELPRRKRQTGRQVDVGGRHFFSFVWAALHCRPVQRRSEFAKGFGRRQRPGEVRIRDGRDFLVLAADGRIRIDYQFVGT